MLARVGAPDIKLHSGRHTTVDLLYAAGVPEDLIEQTVGHSTRTMTRAYRTTVNQARTVQAMEMFGRQFTLRTGGFEGISA
jgi:integrase